jgi:F-type H+-transporting ATPase subunit gamma
MSEVLSGLSAKVADEVSQPLLNERGDEKYMIVTVSADKGLAGGFNANIIKATQAFINENSAKSTELVAVGRKGRDYFKRRSVEIADEYIGLTGSGQVVHQDALDIARKIIQRFTEDTSIDKVFLVYTEFRTVLSQKPIIEQILPVPPLAQDDAAASSAQAEYIYEQPAAQIFERLLPKQVETQLYKAMLESVASEQGSRMTAMDSASKNAGELIDTLTLNMNRIRQAAITKEIIEIVSGAAAL